MSATRTTILAAAVGTTVCAAAATVDHWGGTGLAPTLRLAAATAWITLTVAAYGEAVLAAVRAIHRDIDVYGDHRHNQGVADTLDRQPIVGIRGLH